ncbi:hypothetical protein T492DRAFT_847497 [Pavlovales sp. CCMP2436]|nr:hypothetical protein T492DRAFT_847497 [Pavlovales sp. CCMP2436]
MSPVSLVSPAFSAFSACLPPLSVFAVLTSTGGAVPLLERAESAGTASSFELSKWAEGAAEAPAAFETFEIFEKRRLTGTAVGRELAGSEAVRELSDRPFALELRGTAFGFGFGGGRSCLGLWFGGEPFFAPPPSCEAICD